MTTKHVVRVHQQLKLVSFVDSQLVHRPINIFICGSKIFCIATYFSLKDKTYSSYSLISVTSNRWLTPGSWPSSDNIPAIRLTQTAGFSKSDLKLSTEQIVNLFIQSKSSSQFPIASVPKDLPASISSSPSDSDEDRLAVNAGKWSSWSSYCWESSSMAALNSSGKSGNSGTASGGGVKSSSGFEYWRPNFGLNSI